ncbi:hypothetical protein CRYUN_Cryun12cG0025300 [Craigia yunnanensis]
MLTFTVSLSLRMQSVLLATFVMRIVVNFVLRRVLCNFNMHFQCHPSIPKTIEHKCHIHSLSLTKSPFAFELNSDEDAYNSDDEFYCDVLPPLQTDHADQSTLHGEEIYAEEKNISAINSTLSKLDEEIVKLRVQREPLESESKQLEKQLKALTTKLEDFREKKKPLTDQLEELQVERYMHQYKYSTDQGSAN